MDDDIVLQSGAVTVAHTPWEGRILGHRMAAIRRIDSDPDGGVDAALRWAGEEKIAFLVCKVGVARHDLVHALERKGFHLVETVLHHVFDCRSPPPPAAKVSIRAAVAEDCEAVVSVAREAFASHVGRFHSDPRFPDGTGVRLYEEWIRSAFGGYADAIFLASEAGRITGFSVWKDSSPYGRDGVRTAHFSIGGIAPSSRGRGLFRALTLAGMQHYHGTADEIDGPTNLRNLGVQRAYLSLGWRLRDSAYTFHRWLK